MLKARLVWTNNNACREYIDEAGIVAISDSIEWIGSSIFDRFNSAALLHCSLVGRELRVVALDGEYLFDIICGEFDPWDIIIATDQEIEEYVCNDTDKYDAYWVRGKRENSTKEECSVVSLPYAMTLQEVKDFIDTHTLYSNEGHMVSEIIEAIDVSREKQ